MSAQPASMPSFTWEEAWATLQVYDLDGGFLAPVTDGLRSPSALAAFGGELIVAELHARLAVLDAEDRLVGYLGEDPAAPDREGWPNAIDAGGRTVRPPNLRPGRFNSPHGLAVDACGDLYVAEWMIGGRLTRLRSMACPPASRRRRKPSGR